jgi:predicted amidohydrolase YtcJ
MSNLSLHIHNARIWTAVRARPWAESITIDGGRITAMDQHSPARIVIDAQRRTIAPGLIDAHMHLLRGGKSLGDLDLSSAKSRGEFESLIEQRHRELAAEQWLIATGWSQENWPGAAMPDSSWLRAAGDRPTVCYRMDMHAAVVNDAVMRVCDLTKCPEGGRIERDSATGRPTGLMIEAAQWKLVNPLIPMDSVLQRQAQLRTAQNHVHRLGITAVGTMEYARDVSEVFQPLRDTLSLRCRVTLLDRAWPMDFSFGRDFKNDNRLAVIGYKTFIDGTLGSRTARMLADYADEPGNRGMLVELAADGHLHDWGIAVVREGFSPSMHAIGDEAVRIGLDVIDNVERSTRKSALRTCCRIEHAQQIDAADVARFHGRIASMQPLHKADDCRYVRKRLGEARLAGAFAFRHLLDAGALLAFGSDWPVASCDPLLGIRTAVTGLTRDGGVFGADQNLTVDEALRAYTTGAAHALGLEHAGALRVGAPGDLVMFDRDPFRADWAHSPPRVIMTIVDGQVVYDGRCEDASGARR